MQAHDLHDVPACAKKSFAGLDYLNLSHGTGPGSMLYHKVLAKGYDMHRSFVDTRACRRSKYVGIEVSLHVSAEFAGQDLKSARTVV